MKPLVAKDGSNARPSRPRSPAESTVRCAMSTGVVVPARITRTTPIFVMIQRSPLGAHSNDVIANWFERRMLSAKPGGAWPAIVRREEQRTRTRIRQVSFRFEGTRLYTLKDEVIPANRPRHASIRSAGSGRPEPAPGLLPTYY